MNVLVNYATPEFARYRRLSSETALGYGGFACVLERSPADLDAAFRRRHAALLAVPRGGGYWLWKPYVIERALRRLDADDCLFYADAGVFFTGPVQTVAALLRRGGGPLLAFAGSAVEREWTKRDAFVLLGCDAPRYADTRQALAGISAWRRCAESFEFVAAWRRALEDERIVGDAPSRCGAPEYPGFRAHRHDTSAFSLLCKQRGIALHRLPWRPPDPAAFPDSAYPAFALRGMNNPPALLRFAVRPGLPAALRLRALGAAAAETPSWPLRRHRRTAVPRALREGGGRHG